MAKVIQVIDVDSEGHKVRLDDGNVIRMPHGGQLPHIGQEVVEQPGAMEIAARDAAWRAKAVNGDEAIKSDAVDSERLPETQQKSGHSEEA